jgi:streptogramin lyase
MTSPGATFGQLVSGRWSMFFSVLLALTSIGLASGCSELDEAAPAVDSVDAGLGADVEALATQSQAVGPATGDFSECEVVVNEGEFPGLPSDLVLNGGRLQLRQSTVTSPDIWIANSGSNTVSRIDGRNGAVVRNYTVGSSPSRTTVDLNFDMYVANRGDGRVIKIDSDCTCTTTGCAECRAWNRIPMRTDAGLRGLALDRDNNVWVGGFSGADAGRISLMRNSDGTVLATYDLWALTRSANGGQPSSRQGIYGLILDRQGLLWAATLSAGVMCFDTTRQSSCGYFTLPGTCTNSYGITIDNDGNVWFGTWGCNSVGRISRSSFDNTYRAGLGAFPNRGNVTVQAFTRSGLSGVRGLAIDPNGVIWVASSGSATLHRYDSRANAWLSGSPTCSAPVGVGLSDQGHVWTNCISSNQARAYTYGGAQVYSTAVQASPYSYSDFTGYVARNFTASAGTWRRNYTPTDCDSGQCTFDYLAFDGIIPAGATLTVSYRTSVDGVVWSAYSTPSATSPRFTNPDGTTPRYLEVVVLMESAPNGATPSIDDLRFYRCPQMNAPTAPTLDSRYIVNQTANNYGMRWRFTDGSWPERQFEALDDAGVVRCTVASSTARGMGQVYSGATGTTPGCTEENLTVNTQLTRRFRSERRKASGAIEYSPLSPPITFYTAINNPTVLNSDLRFTGTAPTQARVRWCRPQANVTAGLTGAFLERSTTALFSPTDPGYRVISSWDDASRGYANPSGSCGEVEDTGLVNNTTYYYRLRYRNGDGVPSQPLVLSLTTPDSRCCYNGDCDGVCYFGITGSAGVCSAPTTYQAVENLCDGLDNDCDSAIDEGLLNACGLCGPTPVEVCNGLDDDCDGTPDDSPLDGVRYYRDADGDTWGDNALSVVACSRPAGYVVRNGDCNDANAAVNPGATEVCNFIDDDCDTGVDEGVLPVRYYRDSDNDTWGTNSDNRLACSRPAGFVTRGDDCDDTRNVVFPGAAEVCDTLDNDCNGFADEIFVDADIEVTNVQQLTTVEDIAATCDNTFTQLVCSGALAVTVRVDNTGSVVVPAASTLIFYKGTLSSAPVSSPFPLGRNVALSSSEEYTYCFGNVFNPTPTSLHARLSPPSGAGCQTISDEIPNVSFSNGVEVCDGFDNDCDGRVDEAGEACGGGRECVAVAGGGFICAGTLGE